MKTAERLTGVSLKDITGSIPVVKEAFEKAIRSYYDKTHPKLRMLDNFMVFCLVLTIFQIVYGVVMGRDPFNSMLAGVFCGMGQFALCGKYHGT